MREETTCTHSTENIQFELCDLYVKKNPQNTLPSSVKQTTWMQTEQKCWRVFKNHILRDPSSGGTPAEQKVLQCTGCYHQLEFRKR